LLIDNPNMHMHTNKQTINQSTTDLTKYKDEFYLLLLLLLLVLSLLLVVMVVLLLTEPAGHAAAGGKGESGSAALAAAALEKVFEHVEGIVEPEAGSAALALLEALLAEAVVLGTGLRIGQHLVRWSCTARHTQHTHARTHTHNAKRMGSAWKRHCYVLCRGEGTIAELHELVAAIGVLVRVKLHTELLEGLLDVRLRRVLRYALHYPNHYIIVIFIIVIYYHLLIALKLKSK
jgi:hypothetical protein